MSASNVISFSEYLKKKKSKVKIEKSVLELLNDEVLNKPELLEWYNFQTTFNRSLLFLHSLFHKNHVNDKPNPNAAFFLHFSEKQIERHVNEVKKALKTLNRKYVFIDAEGSTLTDIGKKLGLIKPSSSWELMNFFEDTLLKTDSVIVVANVSKSKFQKKKAYFCRALIKMNDDAHLKGVFPKSDLVFIDSASFLQSHWQEIGSYVEILA